MSAGCRTIVLPGAPAEASADRQWRPSLLLNEQSLGVADRRRPVLYVHGATFPSANSILFKFGGASWADALNGAGFSVWGLDFAGYGGSERYPEMAADAPRPASPSAAPPPRRARSSARSGPSSPRPASRRFPSSPIPGGRSRRANSLADVPNWWIAWCSSRRSRAARR